jgi:DNA topoisomerase-1
MSARALRPRRAARSRRRLKHLRLLFDIASDAERAAAAAGLRYVRDGEPGLRRQRRGRTFRYRGPDGRVVQDRAEIGRIRALAIPPAWTDVWICSDPSGHIQAVGRDARGRKQYRYHAKWRQVRDDAKYGRMLAFGRALPSVRARIVRDLRRSGLPREKVLAAVVRLLETTLVRVGNEEYARDNGSFGLTTLQRRHVSVSGSSLRLHFKGKSGKVHEVVARDRGLARLVRRCRRLPGPHVFHYRDAAGRARTVTSDDVNGYLQEITGRDFTAKDFRTWSATVLAAWALAGAEEAPSAAARKRTVRRAVEAVARRLGNTPAICRKSYVHPMVVESYLEGTLARGLAAEVTTLPGAPLSKREQAVLGLLLRHHLRTLTAARAA